MRKKFAEKFMRKNLNTNEREQEGKTMMKFMRKILFVTLLFVALFSLSGKINCNAGTVKRFHSMSTETVKRGRKYFVRVKWRKKNIAVYKFSKKPIVKFIHTDRLTYSKLTHRKGKFLYIEYLTGKQINVKGDGRLFVKDPYNYISYKKSGFKKGDVIRTYCIYNPYSNWEDDIAERYDEKIQ